MLPEICLITPEPPLLLKRLEALLHQGLLLVQYRCRDADPARWREGLDAVADLCSAHGARLLVNAAPGLWRRECPGHGLHLGSRVAFACAARPVPEGCLLSVACHDLGQLRHAQAIGADFALLSPVAPTSSHVDRRPLGWSRFRSWIAQVEIPVYALGGMSLEDLPRARANGAAGIAAISGLCG